MKKPIMEIPADPHRFPFQNPDLPLDERVRDLLGRLTLEEKISLLPQFQAAVPRLGMRAFKTGTEVLHGVGWLGKATVFPQAIGLGSTWDPELVRRIGSAVGDEVRGFSSRDPEHNSLNVWSPVVDLLRDPRAGRNEEGVSEDPFLTAEMSTAYARGLRGDHPFYLKTAPTLKHFFAYNNENGRATTDCSLDPRNLREYYWKAFQGAIRAGAALGVMTSYNLVNGRPNTISPHLEDGVRTWHDQDLMVVSDANGPSFLVTEQEYFADHAESHAAAIRAGLDSFTEQEKTRPHIMGYIRRALEQGLLAPEDVDRAAAHILSIRIRLGEFDPHNPYAGITDEVICAQAHRELAREAARGQLVLLKNEGNALPISADGVRTLAVIGRRADQVNVDHYSGTLPYTLTPLAAIRAALAGRAEVRYAADNRFGAAVRAARAADAAVVIAGNHPTCNAPWAQCPEPTEGKEAVDRRAIHLPEEELIRKVRAANPRTVVVLVSSFPYAIGWTKEHVAAILWSSHAGQELGSALADVLFGRTAPAGRLTQTWYASAEDLPPITEYDIIRGKRTYLYFEGEPLFPFGHGLTYAEFRYGSLALDTDRIDSGGSFTASVGVENAGAVSSDEVVQLYVHARASRVKRPIRELKAFRRIRLEPGGRETVSFTVPAAELAFWDVTREQWTVEKGEYDVLIGRSSADIRARGVLFVDGETVPPRDPYRPTRAENFDEYSGTRMVDEAKIRGNAVGTGKAGGWIRFREMDFGAGAVRFSAQTANDGKRAAAVEVRLDRPDGPLAGKAKAPPTADRYAYAGIECRLRGADGIRDLYLVLRGPVRISRFQFHPE
jgi:beta-glucosidase